MNRDSELVRVLALDPSSTVTGYCVADVSVGCSRIKPPSLVEVGVIRPAVKTKKQKAGVASYTQAMDRIDEMVRDVLALVTELSPSRIFVEIPSGKVHRRVKFAGGAGLTIYGLAVGRIYEACRVLCVNGREVISVAESEWTGEKPKDQRAAETAAIWPAVGRTIRDEQSKDRGLDAADAAGLLLWACPRFLN